LQPSSEAKKCFGVPSSLYQDCKDTIAALKSNARSDSMHNSFDLVEQLAAERRQETIRKKGILSPFVNFDFFSRSTKNTLHMISRSDEYCYPRYADEEQRRKTLSDLTDVQLSNYEWQELARAGWFYNRRTLITFCCGMEMPVTPAGHPVEVHCSLSPQCVFAKSLRTESEQQGAQASGGSEIEFRFSTAVQCSDDVQGPSVEEYAYLASTGSLVQGISQESSPADHWTMENYSATNPRAGEDNHDSLVTNTTPLPSEEFRPFVADLPQSQQQELSTGNRNTQNAQTSVGRLSMRPGSESITSASSELLRGLEHNTTTGRRSPVQTNYIDQINLNGELEGYRARYPQFAFPTVRAWTYEGWPQDKPQTPIMLADAGFFYAGESKARCIIICNVHAAHSL
jgi:hypothetical protein